MVITVGNDIYDLNQTGLDDAFDDAFSDSDVLDHSFDGELSTSWLPKRPFSTEGYACWGISPVRVTSPKKSFQNDRGEVG